MEGGPDLAKGVMVAELAFYGAECGAADLTDDGQDGGELVFGYQFFNVDLPGSDKGGEVAFDGTGGEVAARGDLGNRGSFFIELQADVAGTDLAGSGFIGGGTRCGSRDACGGGAGWYGCIRLSG